MLGYILGNISVNIEVTVQEQKTKTKHIQRLQIMNSTIYNLNDLI